MTEPDLNLLPGVPDELVRPQLLAGAGQEIASGKFASPRSSAALAANAFGWFLERPALLPPFPGTDQLDWPAKQVALERVMRFPWSRGTHPHLDAGIETAAHLIGVESKRYEPYLDHKATEFRPAYDRDWGGGLAPFVALMGTLRDDPTAFRYLDAAQLIKHALGLATEADRIGKMPLLVYLYAEPTKLGEAQIPTEIILAHRNEVAYFGAAVAGASVRFTATTWSDWLERFVGGAVRDHAERLRVRFAPL